VSSLECQERFGDEPSAAAAFQRYLQAIPQCFGAGVKRKRSASPTFIYFEHEETGDDITVKLGSIINRRGNRPPIYYVKIEVTHVDPR
jgi:hypothetical protein